MRKKKGLSAREKLELTQEFGKQWGVEVDAPKRRVVVPDGVHRDADPVAWVGQEALKFTREMRGQP